MPKKRRGKAKTKKATVGGTKIPAYYGPYQDPEDRLKAGHVPGKRRGRPRKHVIIDCEDATPNAPPEGGLTLEEAKFVVQAVSDSTCSTSDPSSVCKQEIPDNPDNLVGHLEEVLDFFVKHEDPEPTDSPLDNCQESGSDPTSASNCQNNPGGSVAASSHCPDKALSYEFRQKAMLRRLMKFRRGLEKRTRIQKKLNMLSGFEMCDIPDCFCHSSHKETDIAKDSASIEAKPDEESATAANDDKTVADSAAGAECQSDSCRLGCVCSSLARERVAPTHCGKVDCMFECVCSHEDIQSLNQHHDINLICKGAPTWSRTSSPDLPKEEVSNDSAPEPDCGRNKRTRKVPARYQDYDVFGASNNPDMNSDTSRPGSPPASAKLLNKQKERKIGVTSSDAQYLCEEVSSDCRVEMPTLLLPKSAVIYCLIHKDFYCSCKGSKIPLYQERDVANKPEVSSADCTDTTPPPAKRRKDSSPRLSSSPGQMLPRNIRSGNEDRLIVSPSMETPCNSRGQQCQVQRLPLGQNVSTSNEMGQSVKLPDIKPTEFWTMIHLDCIDGNYVTCPITGFLLKLPVLKRATYISFKNNTVVKNKIKSRLGENESLALYALPGLQSYIFMGPHSGDSRPSPSNERKETSPTACTRSVVVNNPHEMAPLKRKAPLSKEQESASKKPTPANLNDWKCKFPAVPTGLTPFLLESAHGLEVEKVRLDEVKSSSESQCKTLTITVDDFGDIQVTMIERTCIFQHPASANLGVLCTSLNSVKLWIMDYMKNISKKDVVQQQSPRSASTLTSFKSASKAIGGFAAAGASRALPIATEPQVIYSSRGECRSDVKEVADFRVNKELIFDSQIKKKALLVDVVHHTCRLIEVLDLKSKTLKAEKDRLVKEKYQLVERLLRLNEAKGHSACSAASVIPSSSGRVAGNLF